MATIQKSFDKSLQKGDMGEKLVVDILESKGWSVFRPVTEGAHSFDVLAIKDKKKAIALDVKAKGRMNKYPATGVNENHFLTYKAFSEKHNMPFWIIFVDECKGLVYGNEIIELQKPREVEGVLYPKKIMTRDRKEIRLWPLEAMIAIGDINAQDRAALVLMSQRAYEYNPD